MGVKVTFKTNNRAMKELQELENAGKALDGTIATARIVPNDPSSVEIAIEEMKREVDARIAPYAHNSIVRNFAEKSKASFEQHLRQKYQEVSS